MRTKKPIFLSILAIFKNESHVLNEWIEHYLMEGVEHFFLIDNGSTDDYLAKLKPYLDEGLISLNSDASKWAQVELYNTYFNEFKDKTEWLIICDLDEFVYSRRKYSSIAAFLKSLSNKVGMVQIPWKMFGSSGYIEQPASVVKSFSHRCLYNNKKNETMLDEERIFCKPIVRTNFVESLHVHFAHVGKSRKVAADKKRIKEKTEYLPINEKILKRSFLHLNHYPIQSKDWFMKVKATRGAANMEKYENFRDLEYFDRYDLDSNELLDDELAVKHTRNA